MPVDQCVKVSNIEPKSPVQVNLGYLASNDLLPQGLGRQAQVLGGPLKIEQSLLCFLEVLKPINDLGGENIKEHIGSTG
jgi:hypothetical protein